MGHGQSAREKQENDLGCSCFGVAGSEFSFSIETTAAFLSLSFANFCPYILSQNSFTGRTHQTSIVARMKEGCANLLPKTLVDTVTDKLTTTAGDKLEFVDSMMEGLAKVKS